MLIVIRDISVRTECVLHVAAVLNLAVLAVHDQRHPVFHGHVQRKVGLTVDEGLKRIAQMHERQIRQLAGNLAVRRTEDIVKSRGDKGVQITAADRGCVQWRPSHGKRIHPVFVLKLMGDKTAVLAAAARHDHVVVAVRFPMPIAKLDQLSLARVPIDVIALVLCKPTGRTYTLVIEGDAGTLVRDRAFLAKSNLCRQLVLPYQITLFHFNHCSMSSQSDKDFTCLKETRYDSFFVPCRSWARSKSSARPTSSHGSCIG